VHEIWRQSSLAEVRQGQQILAGRFEVVSGLRQLPSQRLGDSLELSLHLVGVGLVEDGTHQGSHPRAAPDMATVASRSRKLVGPTPLPGGPWQRLLDRLDEATVRSRDHEHHAARAIVPPASARGQASRPHPRWWQLRRRGSLRCPLRVQPVTTSTWTFAVLPASRTLTTRASANTIGYGSLPWRRLRTTFTSASRLWAIVRDLGRRQLRDPKGPSERLEASPRDPEHASKWRAAGEGHL